MVLADPKHEKVVRKGLTQLMSACIDGNLRVVSVCLRRIQKKSATRTNGMFLSHFVAVNEILFGLTLTIS